MRSQEREIQFLRNLRVVRGWVFRPPCNYRLELAHGCTPIMGIGRRPGQRAVSFGQSRGQLYGIYELSAY